VQKVVVTSAVIFYAKIHDRDDEIMVIDARPSDSIALALRAQAPIYVGVELFESNSREMALREEDDEDMDEGLGPLEDEEDDPDR
jgi:bifunctional DNase/RNase